MLQNIRDKVVGWVAFVIIGILCIPFALWGVSSYFTASSDVTVASINGTDISARVLQANYDQEYRQIRERFGDYFRPEFIDQNALRNNVLQSLIRRTALFDWVDQQNYAVTDAKIAQTLRDNPSFHENGSFSKEKYLRQLGFGGLTSQQYEADLRTNLRLLQLQNGIAETALGTNADAERTYQLEKQTRDISYVKISLDDLAAKTVIDDQEISDHFADNESSFQTAERLKVDYLDLNIDALKQDIKIDDAIIQARYQQNQARYTQPETREASHILIRVNEERNLEQAREAIQAIAKRLAAGESFADVAKDSSEDPGSAANNGSLGAVKRGDMVKPFEDALFSMAANTVSEPVETDFGVHLIQLQAIIPQRVQPFEKVRAKIEDRYRQEQAEAQFLELSDTLATLTYENPESLETAATALNLSVQTSDWITRTQGPGIGARPEVRQAAFDLAVLDGDNSDIIELSTNRAIVLRKADYQAARQQTLDEVKQIIIARLQRQKADKQAAELAKTLTEAAAAGTPLTEAAQPHALSVETPGYVERQTDTVDNQVLEAAYGLPAPTDQKAVAAEFAFPNGDLGVVAVTAVKMPAATEMTTLQREDLRKRVADTYGQAEYIALVEYLRLTADVNVREEALTSQAQE